MGRKINLSHLSEEECERILSVLQRDIGLRQKEKERLNKLENEVRVEETKSDILSKQKTFNENHCIRCLSTFSFFFNKKVKCRDCQLYSCKKCSIWESEEKSWVCNFCIRQRQLKLQSCEWFYSNIRNKFKSFGSAKVVRSLSKHRGESDSENDSGYDPSLSSARETTKDRKVLQDLFGPNRNSGSKSLDLNNASSQDLNASELLKQHLNIDQTEEQVRDHIENMIETIIGKGLQETSVERLYKNKQYNMQEIQRLCNRILEIVKDFSSLLQKCDAAGGGAYERILHTYKGRLSEALTNLARSLQLAINNKPLEKMESPMNAHVTIKRIINEIIEDAMGMPILKNADNESNTLKPEDEFLDEFAQTYEDLLASAIVNKIVQEKQAAKNKYLDQITGDLDDKSEISVKNRSTKELQTDLGFEKNKTKKENKKIQADVPSDIEEEEDEIEETDSSMSDDADSITAELSIEKQRKRRNSLEFVVREEIEIIEEKLKRDKNGHLKIRPKTSRIVGIELINSPKISFPHTNSEEESIDSSDLDADVIRVTSSPWQDNWVLGDRRTVSPYDNVEGRKIHTDSDNPVCMFIPEPVELSAPKIGQLDADQLSDLSERNSSSGLSSAEDSDPSDEEKQDGQASKALHRLTKEIVSEFSKSNEEKESLLQFIPKKSFGSKESLNESVSSKISFKPSFNECNVGTIYDDPIFLEPPQNTAVRAGKVARFSCRVRGTKPVDVMWFHNNVEVANSGRYQCSHTLDCHKLDIYDTERPDMGTVMCIAVNRIGECRYVAELRVRESRTPHKLPEFLYELETSYVTEGEATEFTCQVVGYPEPQIKFYKDGNRIYGNENYQIEYLGSGEWSLLILKTTMRDNAEFMCVAMNKTGQATSIARLTVESRDFAKRQYINQRSKESQQISNLSYKMSMTHNQVLESAEDMLCSANQMSNLESQLIEMNSYLSNLEAVVNTPSEIERAILLGDEKQKLAASAIRRATGAALDLLDNEEIKLRNQIDRANESSQFPLGMVSQREKEKLINAPKDLNNPHSLDNIAKRRQAFLMADKNMSYEDFEKMYYSSNIMASDVEKLSEIKKINCGPKQIDSKRYKRDYYINANGQHERKWEVNVSHGPSRSPVNRQLQDSLDMTEEQVYLAAGKIFTLEERIRMLESHVHDVGPSGQKIDDLEDKVATAVAQVTQSEKQVSKVENQVMKLNKVSGNIASKEIQLSQKNVRPFQSNLIPPNCDILFEPSPDSLEPRIIVSDAQFNLRSTSVEGSSPRDYNKNSVRGSLEDLFRTESRQSPSGSSGREDRYSDCHKTRTFEEDWNEEMSDRLLPSVKKLTAQFSLDSDAGSGLSSIRQVHSLTARHVSREFREALKQQTSDPIRCRNILTPKLQGEFDHNNPNI